MQFLVILMAVVTFMFRSDVSPEQQEAILIQVNQWGSIQNATHLKPDTKHPELLRMCYAYLVDKADQDNIIKRLTDIPEIESANIPAKRSLIN